MPKITDTSTGGFRSVPVSGVLTMTAVAAENLSQFRFVVPSYLMMGSEEAGKGAVYVRNAGVGDWRSALGVVQNRPLEGERALVLTRGVSKVVADEGVSCGDHVECGLAGGVRRMGNAPSWVVGIALESANPGDVLRVLLGGVRAVGLVTEAKSKQKRKKRSRVRSISLGASSQKPSVRRRVDAGD